MSNDGLIEHIKDIDANGPGVVRMYSGTLVDVLNPMLGTLHLTDIAWGLGRQLRYNGSIKQDYSIAHHSLIMSYYVDERHALEALLHDAAEAYMGDIIHPIKVLYPKMAIDEALLAGTIMRKFGDEHTLECCDKRGLYHMSPTVAVADQALYGHECFSFGDRPGVYNGNMQIAWQKAIDGSHGLWSAPSYGFLYRYHELKGNMQSEENPDGLTIGLINELAEAAWFSQDVTEFEGLDEEQEASVNAALGELW
jgi:hypothetical protein